jgi:tRNA (guanosine-2'-O-)-methyltransferase
VTPQRFHKLKAALERRQPDLTVLADGVHKSHNVAAVLRTCDAAGVLKMHAVVTGGAEFPRHEAISSGTRRWVEVVIHRRTQDAIRALKEDGWQLIAAQPGDGARDFRAVDYTRKVAIVLGAEREGLSEAGLRDADETISIPMLGLGASLNVSVAAALVLYEAQRQRQAAGLYERSRLDPLEAERTLFEWAYPQIARRCRELRRSYPRLGEDGRMLGNPLGALTRRGRST